MSKLTFMQVIKPSTSSKINLLNNVFNPISICAMQIYSKILMCLDAIE